jgi:hypothetical protein
LYGLGTNAGLKRMASSDAGVSYPELLYVRRRFLQKDALREAIRRVVNATLAARLPEIWGEMTTACASDATHYGVWDQNLMTEYHARYRKAGVTIYWHTDKRAACISSQLKRCSSSEVAAMIQGVLRHCTEMTIERQYTDTSIPAASLNWIWTSAWRSNPRRVSWRPDVTENRTHGAAVSGLLERWMVTSRSCVTADVAPNDRCARFGP